MGSAEMPAHNLIAEGLDLDPTKPLTDGRIWGVLIKPTATGAHEYVSSSHPIDVSSKTWTPVPVSARVGFPLQIHHQREIPLPDTIPAEKRMRMRGPAYRLLFDYDTKSPTFGLGPVEFWLGEVLFTRTDGKDMTRIQLECLLDYLEHQVAPDMAIAGNPQTLNSDAMAAKLIVADKLQPEGLHAYFEKTRQFNTIVGRNGLWQNAKSPVVITFGEQAIEHVCDKCYATKARREKPLSKCSNCGQAFYCNRTCQKLDWKLHKKWCPKAA